MYMINLQKKYIKYKIKYLNKKGGVYNGYSSIYDMLARNKVSYLTPSLQKYYKVFHL
jgi:hypothetical protein